MPKNKNNMIYSYLTFIFYKEMKDIDFNITESDLTRVYDETKLVQFEDNCMSFMISEENEYPIDTQLHARYMAVEELEKAKTDKIVYNKLAKLAKKYCQPKK